MIQHLSNAKKMKVNHYLISTKEEFNLIQQKVWPGIEPETLSMLSSRDNRLHHLTLTNKGTIAILSITKLV